MKLYKEKIKNIIKASLLSTISIFLFAINICAEEPDTTPPAIDNVIFNQNGKTLNNGDTFLIEIYAHDDESGIKTVDVSTSSEGQAVGSGRESVYNEEKGCYIFSETIHDSYTDNIYVSEIKVVDNANNITKISVNDNTLTKKQYSAQINPLPSLNLDINFIFEKNSKTVNDINDLGISIETKNIIPSDHIQLIFKDKSDENHRLVLELYQKNPSSNIYDGEIRYGWESADVNAQNEAEWHLERITALIGFPLNEPTFNIDASNYSFTLDKNYIDPTPQATIKSLHLDKNTENVKIEDEINIVIDIETEHKMAKDGQLILYADTNIENNPQTKTINLIYDEINKKYYGIFNIEKGIYPCKWYVGEINICDENGNNIDDTLFINDSNHHYFINVIKDSIKFHIVKLDFYEMNKNNSWEKVKSINNKVDDGTTLKEAGIIFPKMNTLNYKYKQTGWKDQDGNTITEDLKISSNTNLDLYAIYDEKENMFPESKINEIIDKIKKWNSNSGFHIKMDDITIIPKQILEAAKNKNIIIIFEMNGYQWTINGKDITSNNIQDIDMEVILDTNHIPIDLIDKIANKKPTKQLTLKHDGYFGFKAILTINIGKQYGGHYGNLFWHNNTDLTYINSGKISTNGEINLTFNHASDYVIVISNKDMSINNSNTNSTDNKNSSNSINNKDNNINNSTNNNQVTANMKNQIYKNEMKSPATGDSTSFIVFILISISTIAIILFTIRYKTTNKI